MKTNSGLLRSLLPALLLWIFSSGTAPAQLPPISLIPVVGIYANDPAGTWSGDPVQFTVFRDGPTNRAVAIYYDVKGSATNGVDYAALRGVVEIPAGVRTNIITVKPIDLGQLNSRTVELRLSLPIVAVATYVIGLPASAGGIISARQASKPTVRIYQPVSGTSLAAPATLLVCAEASATNSYVSTVEYFANGRSIGICTNNPLVMYLMNPFCLAWSNVPAGDYALTAKATDALGGTSISEPVRIAVVSPQPATVNIIADDSAAAEPKVPAAGTLPPIILDTARFRVIRDGATNLPLTVFYRTGGTAINGLDYQLLPGMIVIPAGAIEAVLEVVPLTDGLVEDRESVVVGLEAPICVTIYPPPPGCYLVGAFPKAEAFILDGPVVNRQPLVRITAPPVGSILRSPVNIPIFAYAYDLDGFVAGVDFWAGTNLIGAGVNSGRGSPVGLLSSNTFSIVWSNVPPGTYPLTARATDNSGLSRISEPVLIKVLAGSLPPTNRPVVVDVVASDPVAIEGTNCWVTRVPTNTIPGWTNWVFDGVEGMAVTNCGPKNAAFTIRRAGATNDPLVVNYALSGTATNGVDYATLPGSITIPAGARDAIIPVVPVDQSEFQKARTVILRIKPSASPLDLRGYLVGVPASAAVSIVDSLRPRANASMTGDNCFQLMASGPDGAWFRVQYSTNLLNWISICTNQVVNGSIDFVDPDSGEHPHRFYRAVPELQTPGN